MTKIARWILVLPAAVAAWYVVLFCGLLAHGMIEQGLCPKDELVSGFCTNARVQAWLENFILLCVATSALVVECAAVLTAPNHKRTVLICTFVLGATMALLLADATSEWSYFFAAIGGGLLGFLGLYGWCKRRDLVIDTTA